MDGWMPDADNLYRDENALVYDYERTVWNGTDGSSWDTYTQNWTQGEESCYYEEGAPTIFEDKGAGTVYINEEINPGFVLVKNSEGYDYTWEGSGYGLSGEMSLTKRGDGTLTINNANAYSGNTYVEGGTLIVANENALGTGTVYLKDATLQLNASLPNKQTTSGTSYVWVEGWNSKLQSTIINNGELEIGGWNGGLNFGGGSSLRLNGALSAKELTLGSGTLTLNGAKLSTVKAGNSLTLEGGTTLNFGFNVTEKDVAKGKAFKVFTFKTIDADITDAALNELLGLGTDAATLAFDTKRKAITLTVTDAAAWNAYAESVRTGELVTAASEDDVLVESAGTDGEAAQVLVAPAAVDPLLGKVADTLVQSTWGTAGASRAFADTIAARGTHATALADGKGSAWIRGNIKPAALFSPAGFAVKSGLGVSFRSSCG
ncbi:MAG: autotransporter-associated beta strand repeat-containing protein [Akkermansia sp.]|nr:autotransporter-associated beta strand repeat-containing protein [Akkermansia sp.]